jgi:Organic solute transporter Ostalpha
MDPHLVAWFSAGAFVLLGFPISMWGIVGHLANYNQPHTQVYIVRILWMVPIYSVESWLAMRFHKHAIYIETLRDLYESYVLHSFLQFLIQVLGGEEALVLMLKDKSPTRGVHMWGFQWCVKPWLMGQPVRKTVYQRDDESGRRRAVKRVSWKSPFFVKCKLGVLQYVLLKFVSSIAVMILELHGWYKEGDFTPRGGYLYICFLTNLSQCWALYCLVIFYYATHTELSPIRPVGKFLSVKSLVFFTWWQSVALAFLLWMGLIPPYSFQQQDWTPEDVAKALQDYLICIEMFLASIVHTFVFPHTEYAPRAVEARNRALNQTPMKWHKKRLGRSKYSSHYLYGAGFWRDDSSRSAGGPSDMEMASLHSGSLYTPDSTWDDNGAIQLSPGSNRRSRTSSLDSTENYAAPPNSSSLMDDYPLGSWDNDSDRHLDPVMDATEEEDDDNDDEARIEERSIDRDDVAEGSHMTTSQLGDEGSNGNGEGDYSEELLDDYDNVDGDDDADDFLPATLPHHHHGGGSGPPSVASSTAKPGFVRALIDTAIPRDMVDSTVGLVKGDYIVERKTLLHHATTSDQYDLFSTARRPFRRKETDKE